MIAARSWSDPATDSARGRTLRITQKDSDMFGSRARLLDGFFMLRVMLAAMLLMLLAVHLALAASTAPATSVDLSFWVQLLEGIALIVVPGIAGTALVWVKAKWKLQAGSSAATILDLFTTAATQVAVSAISKAPGTAVVDVKNATIASYINEASASTQAAMKLKGVTAETLATRIDGAVAMALAPPAPATVVVNAPAAAPAA
jgi:hypothetical protein